MREEESEGVREGGREGGMQLLHQILLESGSLSIQC